MEEGAGEKNGWEALVLERFSCEAGGLACGQERAWGWKMMRGGGAPPLRDDITARRGEVPVARVF